ncbi:MAG: hypothetical protein GY782_05985 [Gammaproteobacteria bacterium]|nr:hypothetical protein [Gammaproteobacteria bacterium]
MKKEIIPTSRPTLRELQRQFEQWRQSREKRSPIPEKLLDEAAKLTEDYSIHQVSRSLHLNHTVLKKRVEDRRKARDTAPTFVEFNIRDTLSRSPSNCIVEMEKADGSKMKMNFSSGADIDLLELGKAFWGNGK